MKKKYGLVKGQAFEDYLSTKAISTSYLKDVLKSPKTAKWWEDHPNERPGSTPAMRFGTMVHTYLLEPERFIDEYVIAQETDRRKKAYKDEVKNNPDKTVITLDEHRVLADIRHSVFGNKFADELLNSPGDAEVSMFWKDNNHNQDMKGRIDYLTEDHVIVDVKTCQDADPRRWDYDARFTFHYNMQAALYTKGYTLITGEVPSFYFVCVESKPPYDVVVRKCDKYFLDEGSDYAIQAMDALAKSLETGIWPGKGDDKIIPLGASEFYLNQQLRSKKNA